jgi:hypothetical protein
MIFVKENLLRIALNDKNFNQTSAPKLSAGDNSGPNGGSSVCKPRSKEPHQCQQKFHSIKSDIQHVVRLVKSQTQPIFHLVTTELEVRLHSYYMIHPPHPNCTYWD